MSYNLQVMNVQSAKIADAGAIYSLINFYAEQDRMLFLSMSDIYEQLQNFIVAEADGKVLGCCALQIIWSDLAEIKSLAVEENKKGLGVGRMLVTEAVERARKLGLVKVFALTLEPEFFEKLCFKIVEKDSLPMKVWSDCANCPKQQNCDEVAAVYNL